MKQNKKVLFITEGKYPNGDAGSVRFYFLSKAFFDLGYSVDLLTQGYSPFGHFEKFDFGRYASLRIQSKFSFLGKVRNHIGMEKRYLSFYLRHKEDYSIVLFGGVLSSHNLKKYVEIAGKQKTQLIFSVVEWFSPSEFVLGPLSITYRKRDKFIRQLTGKDGKVISISSFLTDHFRRQGLKSITIPFVMSKTTKLITGDRVGSMKGNSDIRNFYYAGDPAKKDLLEEMILGFASLPAYDLSKAMIHIFGVGEDFFKLNTRKLIKDKLKDKIKFYGRIQRQDLLGKISLFDFSILLRDADERFSMAGFPTKITESLFLGIPPVTNITSDLGLYLVDKANSVIAKSKNREDFASALHRAINMSSSDLAAMKHNAKETAISKLSIENFESDLCNLIGDID